MSSLGNRDRPKLPEGGDQQNKDRLKKLEEALVASIGFSVEDMMCVDEVEDEEPQQRSDEKKRKPMDGSKRSDSKGGASKDFSQSSVKQRVRSTDHSDKTKVGLVKEEKTKMTSKKKMTSQSKPLDKARFIETAALTPREASQGAKKKSPKVAATNKKAVSDVKSKQVAKVDAKLRNNITKAINEEDVKQKSKNAPDFNGTCPLELDYNEFSATSVDGKRETAKKNVAVKKNRNEKTSSKAADPKISAYVHSLINLEFDVKKYTCFFCNPCKMLMMTTACWEEHVSQSSHRKNVCRWRDCLGVHEESRTGEITKAGALVESYSDVVVGADWVVEICNKDGQAHSWVCVLCSVICQSSEQLLTHLSAFDHIDNFMEKADPGLYRPPGTSDHVEKNKRVMTVGQKRGLLEEARQRMDRHGRGHIRIYVGDRFKDWTEELPDAAEFEEQVVVEQMELLFSDSTRNADLHLSFNILPKKRSVANQDYEKIKDEINKTMIGMQFMLEIWTPSRRVTPVYYCILCDYLVTNWTVHCTISKHCVNYLMKHYKSVYECVLLESANEEEFRRALTIARDKVLMLEGRQMRLEHVVAVTSRPEDTFVPINAKIAKQIVKDANLIVPEPLRLKRQVVKKEPAPVIKGKPPITGQTAQRPIKKQPVASKYLGDKWKQVEIGRPPESSAEIRLWRHFIERILSGSGQRLRPKDFIFILIHVFVLGPVITDHYCMVLDVTINIFDFIEEYQLLIARHQRTVQVQITNRSVRVTEMFKRILKNYEYLH